MERTYTYDNAIIHISIPDGASLHIQKATENFMKKVVKERDTNNVNINKTRSIREK